MKSSLFGMNGKNLKHLLFAWVFVSSSIATIAGDYPKRGPGQKILERMDSNDDGVVSATEFRGPEKRFSQIDKNGDGQLSTEEIQNAPRGKGRSSRPAPVELLEKFDGNGDNVLSADEFMGPEGHFEHLDKDSNGFLSLQELRAGPPDRGRRSRKKNR